MDGLLTYKEIKDGNMANTGNADAYRKMYILSSRPILIKQMQLLVHGNNVIRIFHDKQQFK
jgi:hypothetical protein